MWTVLLGLCPSTESPLTHWSTSTPSAPHSLSLCMLGLQSGVLVHSLCVICRTDSLSCGQKLCWLKISCWNQTSHTLHCEADLSQTQTLNHFSFYVIHWFVSVDSAAVTVRIQWAACSSIHVLIRSNLSSCGSPECFCASHMYLITSSSSSSIQTWHYVWKHPPI